MTPAATDLDALIQEHDRAWDERERLRLLHGLSDPRFEQANLDYLRLGFAYWRARRGWQR